jgi:hypothetical protein
MSSACFAAALDCRHFIQPSFECSLMNRKNIPNAVSKIFGAGVFFLIVVLSAGLASAADVTLAWDANTEADLEGYGVYFNKGTPGPPYDLFGYITTGEFSDPNNPTSTVTGLDKGARYYFAVTAYDTDGNESYFSSSVCAEVGDVIAPCAVDSGGSSGGGGGSGGGAGCFIEAASADMAHFNHGLIALTALGCFAVGLIYTAQRRSRRLLPFLLRSASGIRSVNKAGRD